MMANNNLLNFVNNASCSIQDAMGKPPKKKRVVNVRKFVQSRVKRLDNVKPRATIRPKAPQLSKPVSRLPPTHSSSCTWPDIGAAPVSVVPCVPAQTEREITTYACPTTAMPTTVCDQRCYSAPDLFRVHQPQQPIDPELESLLSSLASPSDPLSRQGSFESIYPGIMSRASPSVSMPVSPYSDYSTTDDLDSAYCSPIESARLSSNCSPTSFSTVVTAETASSLPTWTSLLQTSNTSPEWPAATTASCVQEILAPEWLSSDSMTMTTTTTSSVYDQGPPMTPTVSQLLEQYSPYC